MMEPSSGTRSRSTIEWTEPSHVNATEYVKSIHAEGGSNPHLIRGFDNETYVLKLQDNSQGTEILANEYVACNLGRILTVDCPQAVVLRLDEDFIEDTKVQLEPTSGGGNPSPGLHLGSRAVGPWNEIKRGLPRGDISAAINLGKIPWIVALDILVDNEDRKDDHFVVSLTEVGPKLWPVDFGHTFGVDSSWSDIEAGDESNISALAKAYEPFSDHVDFERGLPEVAEGMAHSIPMLPIRKVVESAPLNEWSIPSVEVEDLESYITERGRMLPELTQSFLDTMP